MQYEAGFFSGLTSKVVEILGDAFPELRSHPGTSMTPEKVAQVILEEEVRHLCCKVCMFVGVFFCDCIRVGTAQKLSLYCPLAAAGSASALRNRNIHVII